MKNNAGTTALMTAALMGHYDIVHLLLKYEERIVNNEGKTALIIALENCHWDCCKQLESEKNIVNPMFIAIQKKAPLKIIERLLKGNAGKIDQNGKKPSDYCDDEDVKRALKKAGDF